MTVICFATADNAAFNLTARTENMKGIAVPLPALAQQDAFNQLRTKVAVLLTEQAVQREQLEQLRKRALEQALA